MNYIIKAASCLTTGVVRNSKIVSRPSIMTNLFKINQRLAHNGPNTYDFARERIMLILRLFDKIDANKIKLDSHFYDDLGLDSLDHVEIIMAFEDEFNYEIPDKDAEKLLRPCDVLKYITDKDEAYEELQKLEIADHHHHHGEEGHALEHSHSASTNTIDLNYVKRHFSTSSPRFDEDEGRKSWRSMRGGEGEDKVETTFLKDVKPDMISLEEIQERVLKVCTKYDKIDSTKLNMTSHFFEDLGLDSLDHVEIMMELEDEFNCTIPDQDAEKFFRPGDIVKYLVHRQEHAVSSRKGYEDRF